MHLRHRRRKRRFRALVAMGAKPVANTPAELGALYLGEMERLGKLVKLGLKAE